MKWDVVADRVAGGELVQMSTSTDGGRTWSPAVTIVARSGHRGLPLCQRRQRHGADHIRRRVHWTPVTRIPIDPVTSSVDHLGGGLGVDPVTAGRHARLGLFYNFYPRAACTVRTCRLFEGYVSSADGGARWSAPRVLAGPMRMRQLPFAFGYMVGDYEGAAVVPGGRAFSAFAVGGIPAGQAFNQAMYQPSRGEPITGGPVPASAAGARRGLRETAMPGITR